MTEPIIHDEQLHAFIDGELDPAETQRIAAIVEASPELAERIMQFEADKALIHRIYSPLIEQPIPAALLKPFEKSRARRFGFRFNFPQRPAAALAAAMLLLVAGWFAYPNLIGGPRDPLVAEALAAQNGDVSPERTLMAEAAGGDRIAEETLGAPVKIPNLEKAGYVLKGVAVFPKGKTGHSLQARYSNGAGQAFVVYMRRSAGPDRFDLQRQGQTQICVWQNDELSVVMTGEMSAKEMLKVANLTYTDLNF